MAQMVELVVKFKKVEESMNTMKRKIKNIFKNPNQISRDEKLITDIKIH